MYWRLRKALVCSADPLEITEVTARLGFYLDLPRDNSLKNQCISQILVLRWAADELQRFRVNVERFRCIMLSTPLFKGSHLVGSFNILKR